MRFMGVVGILAMIGIAYIFSTDRKKIRWETVYWGLGLQIIFALIILKTDIGEALFAALNDMVLAILSCASKGAEFVFGKLTGFTVPVGTIDPASGDLRQEGNLFAQTGGYFAFTVLPTIIFFSSFMAILYHAKIMDKVVRAIAWLMAKTLKTSGPESLSCASNIFVGQTEAPLVIRPFINKLSPSELTAVMAGGFATIAGGVMAAYVGFLSKTIPNVAGHLIAASVMSAPAALLMAKIFVPEIDPSRQNVKVSDIKLESIDHNLIDAAARGASEGLGLALNVGAMLVAFIALVTLADGMLSYAGGLLSFPELSLSWIFGKIFAPFAFLLGVPWEDCSKMGDLLGTKIVLNEFVAYAKLKMIAESGLITEKTKIIATYALCGFANVGSIGIQIGGIAVLAPERKHDVSKLAVRALIAGLFASAITGCIAGILI